jgi:hypothetical protein
MQGGDYDARLKDQMYNQYGGGMLPGGGNISSMDGGGGHQSNMQAKMMDLE